MTNFLLPSIGDAAFLIAPWKFSLLFAASDTRLSAIFIRQNRKLHKSHRMYASNLMINSGKVIVCEVQYCTGTSAVISYYCSF